MTDDKKPQPGEPLPEYSIMWIDVNVTVPGNRREVLAFGETAVFGHGFKPLVERGFLGATRYYRNGRECGFDIERGGFFLSKIVTHWAEITDPEGRRL